MVHLNHWSGGIGWASRSPGKMRPQRIGSWLVNGRRSFDPSQHNHPNLHWLGSVSGSEFLRVVCEVIDVLTHRTAQPELVLADLLVADEFRRAYNVGGRFEDPQFSALPWFARFLVLAALNQVLLAFPATPRQHPEVTVTVDRLLNRFFQCLPFEQKAGILKRTETWPHG